jgi:RHS repeat-associated protein
VVLNDDGTVHSETRHSPYGEERWRSGTLPTDYPFAGQRSVSSIKLYHMGARFYDSALGRWISADTIVPDAANPQSFNRYSADTLVPEPASPQSYNRFSYVEGNPLRFVDPSGRARYGGDDYDPADEPWTPDSVALSVAPQSHPVPIGPEVQAMLWGLLAQELGPRDDQGNPIIDQVFAPFPAIPDDFDDEAISDNHRLRSVVLEAYGGWEGLEESISEACTLNHCNNTVLGESWTDLEFGARLNTSWVLAGRHKDAPLGYFLLEVRASPDNLYNYEPFWLAGLMEQYPRELMKAQGKWVWYVYLEDPELWQYLSKQGGIKVVE